MLKQLHDIETRFSVIFFVSMHQDAKQGMIFERYWLVLVGWLVMMVDHKNFVGLSMVSASFILVLNQNSTAHMF